MNEVLLREIVKELLIIEAGTAAERQERGVIEAINMYASKKNPVTVSTQGATIRGVIQASKFPGLSKLGKEPYTDIVLHCTGNKSYNISAKGETAPSLAGGGLVALNILAPDLISTFLKKARKELMKKYSAGDQGLPDVFGKIPADMVEMILAGNEDMGGPIHYMYQGPMDVEASWKNDKEVMLNGVLTPIEEYAKTHDLYLRARKRRIDQPFDPAGADAAGLPLIFGKSPTRGDIGRRIVISDKPSANSILIKI